MEAKIDGEAVRLRIFIGEASHYQGKPLYHAIVMKARELGLAGATVMRALEGFGASSRIHTSNLLTLSGDLPVVVEIVDSREMIDKILPELENMVTSGLVTMDPVTVLKYIHSHSSPNMHQGESKPRNS